VLRTRTRSGPRRRRMIRGTIVRIGDLTMRYGRASQLAPLDCTSSRRNTVMCALPRATVVTTVYQRDSSSKRPRSSVVSAARVPARASPRRCQMTDPACRVAGGGYPPPALTEPDLWASHPALRDVGVSGIQSAYSGASITARSYSSAKVSCAGATTRCRSRYRTSKERSPCSAKYRLSRAWSTGPQWLSAHKDLWPS
jgi:hypothetical protein